MYTTCFAFTIAGNAYEMFSLAYSQAMYTQSFTGIVAGYAYKTFCCHNRRIRIQNVLLPQSQEMYKMFCWQTRRKRMNCFAVTIVGQIQNLILHNRRKCTKCFAVIIAGYVQMLFCHNRKKVVCALRDYFGPL